MKNTKITKFAVLCHRYNSCNGGCTDSTYIAKMFDTRQEAKDYIKTRLAEQKEIYCRDCSQEVIERCLDMTKNSIGWYGRDTDSYQFNIEKLTIAA